MTVVPYVPSGPGEFVGRLIPMPMVDATPLPMKVPDPGGRWSQHVPIEEKEIEWTTYECATACEASFAINCAGANHNPGATHTPTGSYGNETCNINCARTYNCATPCRTGKPNESACAIGNATANDGALSPHVSACS